MLRGNMCIGIVREVYNKWERRAPLCPEHVARLVSSGLRVLVQPSNRRIFSADEYERAGATVTDDLSPASVVFGVKQVPVENLLPDRTYVFFSHVIKAQPANMPLLDALLAKNIRLIDYECITKNGQRLGPRLIAFGGFAGMAGMVTTLRGLGERLLSLGYSTPFASLGSTYMYPRLESAKEAVCAVGAFIRTQGLPVELAPMTFTFTGTGNVSHGALEMFKLLPHEMVSPEELPDVVKNGRRDRVYGTIATSEHMVTRRDAGVFNKAEYYENPALYKPIFHEKVVPYTSVLMNCMYWDQRFPRLLTIKDTEQLWAQGQNRLLAVGDISCDVNGSVEFFTKSTNIEQPFFLYDVKKQQTQDLLDGEGVLMMGVDILPSELPRDASYHFGQLLEPYVLPLAKSNALLPYAQQTDLPLELRGACITAHGELTPNFTYISKMRKERERKHQLEANKVEGIASVILRGHLFDSGLINKALDLCEAEGVGFEVTHCMVQPNTTVTTATSSMIIRLHTISRAHLDILLAKLRVLIQLLPQSEGSLSELTNDSAGVTPKANKFRV